MRNIFSFLIVLLAVMLSSCAHHHLQSDKFQGKASAEVWFPNDTYNTDSIPVLVKKNNEDYKILLLADIQVDWFLPKAKRGAFKQIKELIEKTNPDFILTLGDNVQGLYVGKMTKKLIKEMTPYNIPWAAVLGNHDSEGRRGRAWHGNRFEEAENSLFSYGPSNIHGVGNYTVHLQDEAGQIIYSFIMMDSHIRRPYEGGSGYDFIHLDQMLWYEWQVRGVSEVQYGQYNPEAGKVVPSICFFHIPLPEFSDAANSAKDGNIDTAMVMGENHEGVGCAKRNSGFFDMMKKMKSTTDVIVGHDHVNNMSIDYQGIRLTYGLKTGPSSYYKENMQGGTLLTIKTKEDGTAEKVDIEYIYLSE
ncbi:MAG: metallophosphoesterase [Bacteroidales bacterium]|nr:metallophosphoesterase [Bacteroidales bacterium]